MAVVPGNAKYDLNGDNTINTADLDKWLADAATINGFGSPYYKGDANLDGDVDVFQFDGNGDAQILGVNLGTTSGAAWGDGDSNGDGDVDVFQFDGNGDAQLLGVNLGSFSDVGADQAAGQAEALYNPTTGELFFDLGGGVTVVGIQTAGLVITANATDLNGTNPGQNDGSILAYFNFGPDLGVGEYSVGAVLPLGLTAGDINFSYTITGGSVQAPVFVIPEPSSILLLAAGAVGLAAFRRRRKA